MALLKFSEIGDLIGRDTRYVSTYVKRGKFIALDTGMKGPTGRVVRVIDTDDPTNAATISNLQHVQQMKEGLSTDEETPPTPKKEKPKAKAKPKVKPAPQSSNGLDTSPDYKDHIKIKPAATKPAKATKAITLDKPKELTQLQKIEIRKKEADLKKIELETQKIALQNAKLQGELIPVELIITFIATINKSVFQAIEKEGENWAGDLVSICGGTNEDRTTGLTRLKNALNRANDAALREMESNIDMIIEEYSSKRGRGERL